MLYVIANATFCTRVTVYHHRYQMNVFDLVYK